MRKYSAPLLLTGTLLFFTSGCATLLGDKNYTSIRLPEAHQILFKGEKKGRSATLLLPNTKKPRILYLTPDQKKKTLYLGKKYNWRDSLGANLFLLSLAPIGAGIDFATGHAWSTRNYFSKKEALILPNSTLFIRLPKAPDLNSAEEGGRFLTRSMAKKFPKAKVISLQETLDEQIKNGFSYRTLKRPSTLPKLIHKYQTDYIVESEVTLQNNPKIDYAITDIFENKKKNSGFIPLNSSFRKRVPFKKRVLRYLAKSIPNTVGLNVGPFGRPNLFTPALDGNIDFQNPNPFSLGSLLSGLSIFSIVPKQYRKNLGVSLYGSSRLGLVYRTLRGNSPQGSLFDFKVNGSGITLGFAGGLALDLPIGRIFLEVIPSYGHIWWNYVNDFTKVRNRVVQGSGFVESRIGYELWITRKLIFRLEASQFNTGQRGLQRVFEKEFPGSQLVNDDQFRIYLGYDFFQSYGKKINHILK